MRRRRRWRQALQVTVQSFLHHLHPRLPCLQLLQHASVREVGEGRVVGVHQGGVVVARGEGLAQEGLEGCGGCWGGGARVGAAGWPRPAARAVAARARPLRVAASQPSAAAAGPRRCRRTVACSQASKGAPTTVSAQSEPDR